MNAQPPGDTALSESPVLLLFACLLKYGPFRDSLQAAFEGLCRDEQLALRNGEPRAMHTVLTKTFRTSSGMETSVWRHNTNRGRVARLHGCGFGVRLGILVPWRGGGEARGVLSLDGALYTSAPLAGLLLHRLASLAPLQVALRVFLACPPRA